jgi:hypothetical protein
MESVLSSDEAIKSLVRSQVVLSDSAFYRAVRLMRTRIGVVRQSLTGLKVPRSNKSMKLRFETTPREQLCIFA